MKTKRTGLWICLLVLITLLLCACGDKKVPAASADTQPKLYWNVNKYIYSDKDMLHTPRDGQYYIRFAVDGKQVEYPVKDSLLVSHIDTMEVMGLVFDEQGVVVDALRVDEFYGSIPAEDNYVLSIGDNEIVCNAMANGKGLTKTLQLSENTQVYYWDEAGSVLCGLTGQIKVGSKILAVADENGLVTHVYTKDPFVVGDVYWNHQRQFDTISKLSTRQLDEFGRFVYQFSMNGQQLTLYTRDQEMANKVDGVAARCMGLSYDENGYIQEVYTTKSITGGKSWGSWFYVLRIDGNVLYAEKFSGSDAGSTTYGELAADCKIFDVSGKGAYIGEPTQLRLYDQVHGLKNEHGQICVLFVVGRTYEADIYYNVERKYDSAAKQTKRTPAADGYYYIRLSLKGQQVTLKTNNKDIVNSIDAAAARCFGLKVENGEILEFYGAGNVWGGRQFCSYDFVTEIRKDGTIVAKENDVAKNGNKTYTGKMAENCGVYNVSTTAGVLGEKTTLRVGDKIHALKDWYGNVTHIFVVSRSYRVPIYWNVNRQYDSENKTTLRTPNEEGYYEIVLAVNGQQKTFKTKSKDLITQLDAAATKCFGLSTDGDVILKMYKTTNVYGGAQFCSWDTVTSIRGNTVVAKESDGSKTYTGYMTSATKIYNVTGNGEFIGEKTTLQVGDKIHALKYPTGSISIIYVVSRTEKVIEETAYCQLCQQDVTWYSWDGAAAMEHDKHYFLKHSVSISKTAYIGAADQTDTHVTLDLRGHDIRAAVRAFRIYGTFDLLDTVGEGVITGNTTGQASVFYVYENAVFNLYGGTLTSDNTVTSSSGAGIGGVDKGTMNMYGGLITGGTSQKSGGNLSIYDTGILNLYGGTIQDGTSLEASGGNIQLAAKAQLNLYGGSILGGSAANLGSCINANGAVTVYGQNPVMISQIYLPNGKTLAVPGVLAENSMIGVLLENSTGVFTEDTAKENQEFFCSDDLDIVYAGGKLMLATPEIPPEDPNAHWHCICGGLGAVGDHTTCAKVIWTPWPGVENLVLDGSVYYYLEQNIEVSTAIKLTEGQTLNLCLNGCTISTDQKIYIFDISGTLNICDHAENKGAVTNLYAGTSHSMAFYVRGSTAGSLFNMYGGTYSAPNGKSTGTGGGVARVGTTAGGATFKMYGGTILGGNAAGDSVAANLVLDQKSVTWLYGGSITGGNNTKGAGNVILKGGSVLNLDGGSITDGTGVNGGNVHVSSGCTLTALAGSIVGGSVYAAGTVTVSDNAIIDEIINP